jgi:sporulation protein YlmC with PRC-barrel domain
MRATDLLGARVVTAAGEDVGVVIGLRCTSDGPKKRGSLPAPRLRALTMGHRGVGAALGYQQEEQRGPWLIRWTVRRLHRSDRVIPWSDVDDVGDGVVRLRSSGT